MLGADGCGKSTIAEHVAIGLEDNGSDVLSIGSSQFEEWLSVEAYERFIGSADNLDAALAGTATGEQLTSLYEDIAVCLYGIADLYAKEHGPVVVDSDPFMKRLAWARLTMGDDQFLEYAHAFDEYVTERVGDVFATHAAQVFCDKRDTFARLQDREGNSAYDPSSIAENDAMHAAVTETEAYVLHPESPIARGRETIVRRFENPSVAEPYQNAQAAMVARQIVSFSTGEQTL